MNLTERITKNSDGYGAGAQEPSEALESGLDLRAIFGILWRGKWVLVLLTLLGIGIGYVVAKQIKPIYAATATVMLNTRETNVVDVESVLSGLPATNATVAGEIALITSFQLLDRVVKKFRLERDPEFNPPPGTTPLWRRPVDGAVELMPEDVRLALGVGQPEVVISEPLAPEDVVRVRVVNRLRGALAAEQQRRSPIITISVASGNRDKAVLLSNAVAEQYIIDQLEAKFEATQRATSWLNERVQGLKDQLEQSEAAVETFRASIIQETGQGVELVQQQLAELNSQLIEARAARAAAEARLNQVRRLRNQVGAAAAADAVDSSLIQTLRGQRAELLRREAELSTRYGDRHPTMINLRAEIQDVNGAIAAEARKSIGTLENEVEVARSRERTLQDTVSELEQKSVSQAQVSVQLRQLEREAEANRLIYENFLARFKETSEQEDLQEADARLISPAKQASFAGTPRKYIVGGAGAAGLALGLALLFLYERLNNTFRSTREIEEQTGVSVLASLPRFGRRRRRAQVLEYVRENSASALAEAVRNLRTSLFLANIDHPPRVVMITSSLAGEGKSTTCLLLAEMSTLMGKKAIIVDCDLRRPTLYRTFGVKGDHDLISVLAGSASLEEATHLDEASGLAVLPTLKSAPQAADVLSSNRFGQLVKKLTEDYDLVLLDSPPILLVSDAGVIGKHADASVYAVQWDKTPREAVMRGLKQFRDLGVAISGVALTLVNRKRQADYSYYRYGYGDYQNQYYTD